MIVVDNDDIDDDEDIYYAGNIDNIIKTSI